MSEIFDEKAGQPLPITTSQSIDVAVAVASHLKALGYNSLAEDVESRILIGERKYGSRLKSFNGRDTLKDLSDEVLDSLNYSKQAEIEGLEDGSLFTAFVDLAAIVQTIRSGAKNSYHELWLWRSFRNSINAIVDKKEDSLNGLDRNN